MSFLLAFPLLAVSIACAPLAVHAWLRRNIPGALSLSVMAIAAAEWSAFAAINYFVESPTLREYLIAAQYLGIAALPPAWFAFTVRFTDSRIRINAAFKIFAAAAAVVMCLLVALNDSHHWVWRWVEKNGQIQSEAWIVFWIFTTYAYFLCGAGIVLILQKLAASSGVYRWQCVILLAAGLAPVIVDLIGQSGFVSWIGDNAAPFGFFASVILMWWGLLRFRLLDLAPVAHAALLECMQDGMLVVDERGQILDCNKAALTMFPALTEDSIGKSAAQILPFWPQLSGICHAERSRRIELTLERSQSALFLETQLNPLLGPHHRVQGCLLIFRDVTEQHQIEREREELLLELQTALDEVKTLSGLLPICTSCKKIRDDSGEWHPIEVYLTKNTEAQLSHGFCPECFQRLYPKYSSL